MNRIGRLIRANSTRRSYRLLPPSLPGAYRGAGGVRSVRLLAELEQLAMGFPVSTGSGLSQIKGLGWAKD
jgi:hypothetical protein